MNPSHSIDMEDPNEQKNRNAQWLQQIQRKICKVPPLIRWENGSSGAYDPKVVSFGPYHHGKYELQTCEEAKRLALQVFIEGSNRDQEFFKAKVLELISEARNCYIDGSTEQYTDEQFAEMMLLDSCFLIYLIYVTTIGPQATQDHLDYVTIFLRFGNLAHSSISQDVFLMENQIPFKVLMLLITLRFKNGEDIMSEFLQKTAWNIPEEYRHKRIRHLLEVSSPLHLLEALHVVLVWDEAPKNPQEQIQSYMKQRRNGNLLETPKTYLSAKDLKAKGLSFRPSFRKSLKAIYYKSFGFCGVLELPPAYASSLWKVVFLNLIAYELCPNNVLDFTVICYVNFMKSLIVSSDDVKELREKRVLLTSWTDEAVVRFFEDLDTFDIVAVDKYYDVKLHIQQHYNSKAAWMAEWFYTYFRTPWSGIVSLSGVFLLFLTVLQTYFTVYPKSGSRL